MHPAPSAKPNAPSTWSLAILCLIAKLPGCELQDIWQSFIGAISLQHTRLLTIYDHGGISSLERYFRSCLHLPPLLISGRAGKDSKAAKEAYVAAAQQKTLPHAFCQVLATAFHQVYMLDNEDTIENIQLREDEWATLKLPGD